MANYPQEFAQDAVCQSHTGHMTGLWFLPARTPRLNTNERTGKRTVPTTFNFQSIIHIYAFKHTSIFFGQITMNLISATKKMQQNLFH